MATEFRAATLEGAGMALRELVKHGNAEEAQVSIAFMLTYLCDIYEIDNQRMVHVLMHNMEQLRADPSLKSRVFEKLHNLATRDHEVIHKPDDHRIETSHKVGDLKRHGQLPVAGVMPNNERKH